MSVKSIVKNHSVSILASCVRNEKFQQNQTSSGSGGIAKMIAKKQTTITPVPLVGVLRRGLWAAFATSRVPGCGHTTVVVFAVFKPGF